MLLSHHTLWDEHKSSFFPSNFSKSGHLNLEEFQSWIESLKLTFFREFVPLIWLSCLSSSLTSSLVSLPTPGEISYSNWEFSDDQIRHGTWDIDLDGGFGTFWFWITEVSHERTPREDPEPCPTRGEGWLSDLLIIADIIWATLLSSFFMSLNSATGTDDCWVSWFSILVYELV